MLLHEIANPNYAIKNLLKDLNFTTTSEENSEIEKRLEKKRIKPTLNNMKRYLLRCFLTPVEELPQPERRIILRLATPSPIRTIRINIGITQSRRDKMLLIEMMNAIPVNNLTNHINFAIYPQENKELSKKLIDLGMKPTISNIKNYMLKWLTVPLDEVPRLERLIIMRSGRPERQ